MQSQYLYKLVNETSHSLDRPFPHKGKRVSLVNKIYNSKSTQHHTTRSILHNLEMISSVANTHLLVLNSCSLFQTIFNVCVIKFLCTSGFQT